MPAFAKDAYTPLTTQATKDEQRSLLSEENTNELSTARETSSFSSELVQFTASMFYATEDDEKAVIDVMRIGTLSSFCSVCYKTEDGSALAGDKYTACEGMLEFEPGEAVKSFEVPITEDDNFDTTLEFGIMLFDPKGCELGKYLKVCRVLILDNDLFPTNELREQIEHGTSALQTVGVKLLVSYMQFTFLRVPTIWWKSIVIFLLDQMQNAYYYMTILIRVYLVDKVLNPEFTDLDELLVAGHRFHTACVLGAVYIIPSWLILINEWLKVGLLDMNGVIQKHLRVNLFRKYLNYSEAAREECPLSVVSAAMKGDIGDIVNNSYIALFELLRGVGKILCVATFILRKDKTSAIPLLIYPIAMICFMSCRYGRQVRLASQSSNSEQETQSMLVRTVMSFGLITDYKQRSHVVSRFERMLNENVANTKALNMFNFGAEQLIPNMSVVFIGVYIAIGARLVIDKKISLGSFLATINVYKDLGDRFENVGLTIRNMFKIVDPLIGITKMLNMGTDLGERKNRNRKRRQFVKDILQQEAEHHRLPSGRHSLKSDRPIHATVPFYDRLPIALDGIEIGHVASLSHFTTKVPQGSMVLITGPHSSGKQTLVGLLTDNRSPKGGNVLCPSHLRCLHVSYAPEMIEYMSLYENLVFGALEADPARVTKLFNRIVLGKWGHRKSEHDDDSMVNDWLQQEFFKGLEEWKAEQDGKSTTRPTMVEVQEVEEGNEQDQLHWHRRMSNNERKRLHLARALIFNPEVLVLHRPVDEADEGFSNEILNLLREFVDKRGLELDEVEFPKRRPRTVFFTGGEVKEEVCKEHADMVWKLGKNGLVVEDKYGNMRRADSSAKYLSDDSDKSDASNKKQI